MPSISSSDSEDNIPSKRPKLFGRQRSLHAVLGGGRVADVILWRNKNISTGMLLAVTVIWSLFEVMEYPFLTLLCHISIAGMLIIFLWSNGAAFFDRNPPKIPDVILSQETFREAALVFHKELTRMTSVLLDIACGKDLKLFLLAIASLWILSVVGSYSNSLNLIYFGFLCLHTLPALYERFEEKVDYLGYKATRQLRKSYRQFDSKVLNKIPRGPVKQKKYR